MQASRLEIISSAHMSHCKIYYDVIFFGIQVYALVGFFGCIFKYDYVVYIIDIITFRSKCITVAHMLRDNVLGK